MRKPFRPIPPLSFLAAVVTMCALHRWLPLAKPITPPWNWLGIVLIVGGLGFSISGALHFRRRSTTVIPFSEASVLVTDGPFRLSRNVMYLGLTVALAGVAVFLGSVTPWAVIVLFVWLIQTLVIRTEERMLGAKFGTAYTDYQSRVRRWI